MNVARNIDMMYPANENRWSKSFPNSKGGEIVSLVSRQGMEYKKLTVDYLNERLAYFYNNGGPIMDI